MPSSPEPSTQPSPPTSDQALLFTLAILAATTFLITSSGPSLAPFLQILADEMHRTLPAIAHLFSFQAVAWGTSALLAGAISDRVGRRPILVAGLIGMGCARVGFSLAPNYAMLLSFQLLGGLFGGAFMGTVFATAADRVAPDARARAFSWIVGGQSFSILLGAPIVTVIGSLAGWRGAIGLHGLTMIFAGVALYRLLGPDVTHESAAEKTQLPWSHLLQKRWLTLLGAGTTERMCFGMVAIFLPTFLQQRYGISLAGVGAALSFVAAGTLLGSYAGAKIADRMRGRMRLFAASSLATAVLVLPLMLWHPSVYVSILLGFAYSFSNALGRPAFLSSLSRVPNELRGAVFGLNVTMASIGWLSAASLGGWIITQHGFAWLGASAAMVAVIGALLALANLRSAKPVAH